MEGFVKVSKLDAAAETAIADKLTEVIKAELRQHGLQEEDIKQLFEGGPVVGKTCAPCGHNNTCIVGIG